MQRHAIQTAATPGPLLVYAAYTTLAALFPTQSFAADLEASLAAIADDSGIENSTSIERGGSLELPFDTRSASADKHAVRR